MLKSDHARDLEDAPDWTRTPSQVFGKPTANAASATDNRNDAGAPTEKYKDEELDDVLDITEARQLGRECYQSSTNWLNAGRRARWNESLRSFQNLHGVDSKYSSNDFRYRSRLFRPKTRSMVRKSEAKAAAAFFSNQDVVNISAINDDDPMQNASAKINQELLQYRLTYSIPWFLTFCGARQDAEVMGICVAKAFWKYKEKYSHTERRHRMHPIGGAPLYDDAGTPITDDFDIYSRIEDQPWVDLLAPENIRFDAGSDWRNPIATSPFLIEMIPMRVIEVREKMESGEWFNVSDGALRSASDLDDDVTRRAREPGRVPGKDNDSWKPKPYDIVWIRENIVRRYGQEWHFFSVGGAGEMLTKPCPLKEIYLHGVRPYVLGTIIPEAHKTYPTAKVELVKDLQTQANDVMNMRLDNVKLALNPRQIAKSGRNLDPTDLRTFMPGKVLITKDPDQDIKWDRPPEVTASSYQEQDKIDMDFDGLAGSQTNATVAQQRAPANDTLGGMELMTNDASEVVEYEQRVFAETFVEPLMRQLVLLEQAYETDPVVLAIAGKQAKLYQKFGMNQITDELLQQQLTVKVNVGVGATNPAMKLKNFTTATQILGSMYGQAAAFVSNPQEVYKEVFGLCGYKDGDRFILPGMDVHQVMQQMQQSQQQQGQHPPAGQGNPQAEQIRLQIAQINASAKLQERQMADNADMAQAQLEYKKVMMLDHSENHRHVFSAAHDFGQMVGQHQLGQQASVADHQRNLQNPQPQPMQGGAPRSAGPSRKAKGPTALHYDQSGKRIQHQGAAA